MRNAWFGLLGLAMALGLALPVSAKDAAKEPAVGDIPPALLGKDRKDNLIDLAAYRGNKIVVVTFWASWCGPCRRELPQLDALQKRAGDGFLKIIAVNWKDDLRDYGAMLRQMSGYTLTLTRDRDGDIGEGYGVHSLPNLWIIDLQGKVVAHHVGYGEGSMDAITEEINQVIDAELKRREAAKTAAAP